MKRQTTLVLAALATIIAAPVAAQVYKCVDPKTGKIAYSQTQCPGSDARSYAAPADGPRCQSADGGWHPYGSYECDKLPVPEWVEDDIRLLKRITDIHRRCQLAIEIHGREAAATDENCDAARETNQASDAAAQRIAALPAGAMRREHVQVLNDLRDAMNGVTNAVINSRPHDVNVRIR